MSKPKKYDEFVVTGTIKYTTRIVVDSPTTVEDLKKDLDGAKNFSGKGSLIIEDNEGEVNSIISIDEVEGIKYG